MTFHLVAWLVAQSPDGRVLLARRSGVSYGEGLWGLPGGHVEPREMLAQAAARETAEEVGLTVDPGELQPIGVSRYVDGGTEGADFFFRTAQWDGEAHPRSECSEVGWFAPDQLPHDTLPWLPGLLTRLLAGEWYSETLDHEALPTL
ncbi:NUDIX domain-containing protein [Deinococcus sonorensis]|uniref:NUDIX domain-containing protein n=2 Tax=Deinococcus sonorensis TaxID=309891 RepID=A0AAU7U9F0_9DEIO